MSYQSRNNSSLFGRSGSVSTPLGRQFSPESYRSEVGAGPRRALSRSYGQGGLSPRGSFASSLGQGGLSPRRNLSSLGQGRGITSPSGSRFTPESYERLREVARQGGLSRWGGGRDLGSSLGARLGLSPRGSRGQPCEIQTPSGNCFSRESYGRLLQGASRGGLSRRGEEGQGGFGSFTRGQSGRNEGCEVPVGNRCFTRESYERLLRGASRGGLSAQYGRSRNF